MISLDNVASCITHTLVGFASLYILISGLCSMRKENMYITVVILGVFCVLALFVVYIALYYYIYFAICKARKKHLQQSRQLCDKK